MKIWAVSALEHEEYVPKLHPTRKDAWNSLGAAAPFYFSNLFNYYIRLLFLILSLFYYKYILVYYCFRFDLKHMIRDELKLMH